MSENEVADYFKALSDENRISILKLLGEGELYSQELIEKLKIKQSVFSHHIRMLCNAKVIIAKKQGRNMSYSISDDGLELVITALRSVMHLNAEGKKEDNQ